MTKKHKENNNDRNRERINGFIAEERRRTGKRKRRIAKIAELNLWAESADYQHVAAGFEQWIRDRELKRDFGQIFREVFGNPRGVKQKLDLRNQEALALVKLKKVKKTSNKRAMIRM